MLDNVNRSLEVSFRELFDKPGNVDANRTSFDAGLVLALNATECFDLRLLGRQAQCDFAHIGSPDFRGLRRHFLPFDGPAITGGQRSFAGTNGFKLFTGIGCQCLRVGHLVGHGSLSAKWD